MTAAAMPDADGDASAIADLLARCEAKRDQYGAKELRFLYDVGARFTAGVSLTDPQVAWLSALADRERIDFDAIRRNHSVASVAGAVMTARGPHALVLHLRRRQAVDLLRPVRRR
jgi:hypothetical protein